MSRYKCYKCESEHGTENMVAACVSCYAALEAKLRETNRQTRDFLEQAKRAGDSLGQAESYIVALRLYAKTLRGLAQTAGYDLRKLKEPQLDPEPDAKEKPCDACRIRPGGIIPTNDRKHCAECGKEIAYPPAADTQEKKP